MCLLHRYILQGKDKTLEECEERMEQLTTQMTTKNADKKELEEKITILTKQLANAKVLSNMPALTTSRLSRSNTSH